MKSNPNAVTPTALDLVRAVAIEAGELVELRPMTPPDAQGKRRIVDEERLFYAPDELEELTAQADRIAPTCEVYVGVNPRRDAPEGQEQRGDKRSISCVRSLVADLDDDAALDAAAATDLPPPSLVAASGSLTASGRARAQAWWWLAEAMTVAEAEPLLKALATALGGDPKVAQAAAVLRLPGTLNHKSHPPRPVEIVGGDGRRHEVEELRAALDRIAPVPAVSSLPSPPPNGDGPPQGEAEGRVLAAFAHALRACEPVHDAIFKAGLNVCDVAEEALPRLWQLAFTVANQARPGKYDAAHVERTLRGGWEEGRASGHHPGKAPAKPSPAEENPFAIAEREAPVDGAALLDEIVAHLERYVRFAEPWQAHLVALYVLASYCLPAFFVAPYLALTSAEKRSGKTRLLEVLATLLVNHWRIAGPPSVPAFFRKLEAECPVTLFDEVDQYIGARDEGTRTILSAINAGYRRGATVPRCVGDGSDQVVVDYSVFSPKVLAGIDATKWPDTMRDRCMVIELRRRTIGERVERFRERTAMAEAAPLRERAERWAAQHIDELRELEVPDMREVDDRLFEIAEPLLAVAMIVGGDWPERAREAVHSLAGHRDPEGDSLGVRLLRDLRPIFDHHAEAGRLASSVALAELNKIEDAPWGSMRDGQGMNPYKLAALLRPYGIKTDDKRFGEKSLKGWDREAFADAWARYLPEQPPPGLAKPDEQCRGLNARQGANPRQTETAYLQDIPGDVADVADVADSPGKGDPSPNGVAHIEIGEFQEAAR